MQINTYCKLKRQMHQLTITVRYSEVADPVVRTVQSFDNGYRNQNQNNGYHRRGNGSNRERKRDINGC